MANAWAFYRRSIDRQELSIDDQRKDVHGYAREHGLTIVREFAPHLGYGSGLTIDRDPAFIEMARVAEHEQHGAQFLIVYDVSRFGRLQAEDKIYWERRFKKQGGIQIVYVKDEFRNDGSIGDVLTRVVKHSEAHQYSVKLSELTLRGAKSHAALGHSAGGAAPYGYDRQEIDSSGNPVRIMSKASDWKSNKMNRVVWIPSPVEAPVVRWVFETYDKGLGFNSIANQLNAQNTPGPRGRFWSKVMVHHMLKNRAYLGERIYNRRSYKAYRRGERGTLDNPREAWVVKENAHPAIVDQSLFDRANARRTSKVTTIGRTFHSPYLLTGIARCSNCGYRMIGQPVNGNGHRYLTYTCSGYLRIGKAICRSVHVPISEIEGQVLNSIRQYLQSPVWKADIQDTLATMISEEFGSGAQVRSEDLATQMQAVNRQIENIVNAIKTAGRFSEALNQSLADLEVQRESIKSAQHDAEARVNQQVGAETLAERILEQFGQFDVLWNEGLSVEEKKELLRCYVHQVNITHSPAEIKAEVWLYRVPVPRKKMTPVLKGIEPIITRVNCGGKQLTQVSSTPPPSLLPLIVRKPLMLGRPYARRHDSAA